MSFIPDQPFPKVQGSTIRSKDWNDLVTEVLRLDKAKANRAGDSFGGPLSVTGGQWDLANTEGDFKVGSAAVRLKVGVVTSGGNAGDARIRSHGGLGRLILGSGTNDVLTVIGDRVGLGTTAPTARLSVTSVGQTEIVGAARSQTLAVTGGALPTTAGSELALASIGFLSGNNSMLGIRARRVANGADWLTTAIGLSMDVDNTVRAGAGLWLNAAGHVGIAGGRWDLAHSEGDLTIGDASYRLKVGVALGGSGAGDARIRAQGGTGCLMLGSGTSDVLFVKGENVGIGVPPVVPLHIKQRTAAAIRLDDHSIAGRYFQIFFETGNGTVVFYHQSGAGQFMRQDGVWQHHSDLSLKEDVAELPDVLDKVAQLRPVRFKWKGTGIDGIGLIAQEVESVFPELVAEHSGADGAPVKGLPYSTFGVLAIGALKEMKRRYDARIEALERQLHALASRT